MQEISKLLREKGLKVTPQRLAIYSMLTSTNEHPTAEMLYKKLVIENPSISLATVYKTLDSFKLSGIVKELSLGENSARYDAITKKHSHVVCNCCGRVKDIVHEKLNNLSEKISDDIDYTILSEELVFYGICPECKNKKLN